jgi:hypothetical protein
MNGEPTVCAPELCLQEDHLPASLHDKAFAPAFTELHGRNETALDFDRGQPLLGLCVRSYRSKDIDHCHSEPTLHIAKLVLERGLRCEEQDNSAEFEVSLFDHNGVSAAQSGFG